MIGTACLPLLDGLGPSYELSEVRDRAVGIVLGIVISAIVFSCLWPESERGAIRQKLSALMRQLGALIRADQQRLNAVERQQTLIQAWSTLNDCDAMIERTLYESDFRSGPKVAQAQDARTMLDRARRILLAQDDVHSALAASGESNMDERTAIDKILNETGDALDRYADAIENDEAPQPVRAQLPNAAFDALDVVARSQQKQQDVLARLRHLLDDVADLPDRQPAPPASMPMKEGPAQ
jgi:multidrug resistance protein MdtO